MASMNKDLTCSALKIFHLIKKNILIFLCPVVWGPCKSTEGP